MNGRFVVAVDEGMKHAAREHNAGKESSWWTVPDGDGQK